MASSKSLVALSLALVASFVLRTAEGGFSSGLGSVVDRSVTGHAPEWDYSDGPNGPAHWGELSPEWAACSNGSVQGPIDVEDANIKLDGTLDVPAIINYHPGRASIYSDGKVLEATWEGGIYNVHDFDYVLDKLAFHAPSEHTYYGERFPLEIQFYHSHPTEGLAINSLVFKEGETNQWLDQFTWSFNWVKENLGESIGLGVVDSAGVEGEDLDWSRYYRYLGSVTSPPCSESPWVVWSLLKSPLTASKEQIEIISAALQNTPNARPIQPIGWRQIYYPKNVDDSN